MTTTVPTSATTATAAPRAEAHAPGASFVTTALTTGRRSILQFFRTPQLVVMGSIQGPLFLLMFRYVFGGAIDPRGQLQYVDWLVPGFLTTVILWTGMSGAAGVAEDSSSGVYDRLRSLPIPRTAVLVGRSFADVTLVAWGVLVTGAVGFAVGFRAYGQIQYVLLGFVLILIAGYSFAWIFITMGLVAGNAQAAQGLSMLVVPFSFVSSANVPVASMPGWMQPFAANQPVSVVINAVRCLMQGGPENVGIDHSTTYWVVASLLWCAGILVVFSALATRRFSRTV